MKEHNYPYLMKKNMKNNHTSFIKSFRELGLFIGLFLFLLTGCEQKIEYQNLDEMVADAKSNVSSISAEEFKTLLDSGKEIKIIDCRQGEDFIEAHIPGAVNVSRGMIGFSDDLTNRRNEIYIYGYNDGCSALAAETLLKLKYKQVKMIDSGWEGWHQTYPEIFEEGGDGPAKKEAPVEESGGCGG